MLSKLASRISTGWSIGILAVLWLAVISGMHFWLNFDRDTRKLVRMGYMPVVTNLAAPLLDSACDPGRKVRYEALKFSSFAEMGEALRNRHIQAAFIIAPLSVVLHQQGAGIKVVYIGNRHESTLVCRKDLQAKTFRDLARKTIAVPMRFSGHNIATRLLAEQFGFQGADLNIVEMNPPDMPAALASGALDAYFVGEPFAAKTALAKESNVLLYVEQVWPGFICNLMIVSDELIRNDRDVVQELVHAAARSGMWAKKNTKAASEIASKYWNQPVELVEYAMDTPPGRIVFDQFIPKKEEMQNLADLMVKFKLLESNDTTGLVDDSFARSADLEGVTDLQSIFSGRSK
jgi:NitT/TauT family transport system substrate-binding protein